MKEYSMLEPFTEHTLLSSVSHTKNYMTQNSVSGQIDRDTMDLSRFSVKEEIY